jgi:hypothetical protein
MLSIEVPGMGMLISDYFIGKTLIAAITRFRG